MPIIEGSFLQEPESPESRTARGDAFVKQIQDAYNSSHSEDEKDQLIRDLWGKMEQAYDEEKSDIPYFGPIRIVKPTPDRFVGTNQKPGQEKPSLNG